MRQRATWTWPMKKRCTTKRPAWTNLWSWMRTRTLLYPCLCQRQLTQASCFKLRMLASSCPLLLKTSNKTWQVTACLFSTTKAFLSPCNSPMPLSINNDNPTSAPKIIRPLKEALPLLSSKLRKKLKSGKINFAIWSRLSRKLSWTLTKSRWIGPSQDTVRPFLLKRLLQPWARRTRRRAKESTTKLLWRGKIRQTWPQMLTQTNYQPHQTRLRSGWSLRQKSANFGNFMGSVSMAKLARLRTEVTSYWSVKTSRATTRPSNASAFIKTFTALMVPDANFCTENNRLKFWLPNRQNKSNQAV